MPRVARSNKYCVLILECGAGWGLISRHEDFQHAFGMTNNVILGLFLQILARKPVLPEEENVGVVLMSNLNRIV